MSLIAVSQRVAVDSRRGERRDCLDQAWSKFMMACGLTPVQVPNDAQVAQALCAVLPINGIILTGGNDLSDYGGDAPERDITEDALIDIAEEKALPILGVCRGMQMIQHRFGIPLQPVTGHVARHQIISIEDCPVEVNSYHNLGATETLPPLEAWAAADDGVVKAVRHPNGRMMGIMWHPERLSPFAERDIFLFRKFFGLH
jgi:gamma-glutamyl-gamma-aminobutyrate hydrolase PuuD